MADWRDPDYRGIKPDKAPNMRELIEAMAGMPVEEMYATMPQEQWSKLTQTAAMMRYGDAGTATTDAQWASVMDDPKSMEKLQEAGTALLQPGVTNRQSTSLAEGLSGLLPGFGSGGSASSTAVEGVQPTPKKTSLIGGVKQSEADLRPRRSLLGG